MKHIPGEREIRRQRNCIISPIVSCNGAPGAGRRERDIQNSKKTQRHRETRKYTTTTNNKCHYTSGLLFCFTVRWFQFGSLSYSTASQPKLVDYIAERLFCPAFVHYSTSQFVSFSSAYCLIQRLVNPNLLIVLRKVCSAQFRLIMLRNDLLVRN